ncbi:MAG: DUF4190 domain-containing protein [Oscillospiraceae bacterium]|nr:DUF4190 domain-containing protein [Oscillospiraceae bacterium]
MEQGYPGYQENKGGKGMAIASLILGILSLLCCCIGFPFAIIGLILAILVLVKRKNGKGLAIGGLITSIICLAISCMTFISMLPVLPYISDFKDFYENHNEIYDEYKEDGTLPDWLQDVQEQSNWSDEEMEKWMDQMETSFDQIDSAQNK